MKKIMKLIITIILLPVVLCGFITRLVFAHFGAGYEIADDFIEWAKLC